MPGSAQPVRGTEVSSPAVRPHQIPAGATDRESEASQGAGLLWRGEGKGTTSAREIKGCYSSD